MRVMTNYPIALDSPDHLYPFGTANDNFTNQAFLNKLYALFPHPIKLLDLGCAGGGMVKNVLDDGHFAIGLEGSDYSKLRGRAEWSTIPNNLFTCDISRPYSIIEMGEKPEYAKFDVITAWEVLEHIHPDRLNTAMRYIRFHLKKGTGLFIGSIPYGPAAAGPNEKWHQTVRDLEWWKELFAGYQFVELEGGIDYFGHHGTDYVRGDPSMPGSYVPIMRWGVE